MPKDDLPIYRGEMPLAGSFGPATKTPADFIGSVDPATAQREYLKRKFSELHDYVERNLGAPAKDHLIRELDELLAEVTKQLG
jgi:hypothetical protein